MSTQTAVSKYNKIFIGKYTCTICGHCCRSKIALDGHMKVHMLNMQFTAVDTFNRAHSEIEQNCKTNFSNGSTLQRHIQLRPCSGPHAQSDAAPLLQCDKCGICFASIIRLHNHQSV